MEELGPQALRFAYVQVRNFAVAEEIVQEAYLKTWKSSRTPTDRVEFKRWLYRSITNLAIDQVRHERQMATHAAGMQTEPDQAGFERWLSSQVIMSALLRLRNRDRQLLYLRYFEDLSLIECARIVGLNRVSVRVQVRRALQRLRQELTIIDPSREVTANAT